jgi:peptidoglycan/LPS O-acetylase OafA/YrhL
MPELDGLRGFAILQVVSIHYFYNPTANFPQGCISFRAFLLWVGPV